MSQITEVKVKQEGLAFAKSAGHGDDHHLLVADGFLTLERVEKLLYNTWKEMG